MIDPKANAAESVTAKAPTVPELARAEILFNEFVRLILPAPETTTP